MTRPHNHPQVNHGRIGILLINLGSPDATSYWSVRRYLREFLTDRRVVESSGPVWWLIFNGIILTRRPVSLAAAYRKIWNHEAGEAPLKTFTRCQSEQLAQMFPAGQQMEVDWAMRYGTPSISRAIARLHDKGCERILLFPLYPQYSAATTATALDTVFETLRSMRWQPTIRTVAPYYGHSSYVQAIADSARKHMETLDWSPDKILASFHSLPEAFIAKRDPYLHHCKQTYRLLGRSLERPDDEMLLTFQSSTKRGKWIGPSTEDTITDLAGQGIRNLLVITPGFAADCLETLEEIGLRGRDEFLASGGENFSVVPCLNDSHRSVRMLHAIATEELQGWN